MPWKDVLITATVAGAGAVIATPAALCAAGFTAAGVASASIAAGIQSGIGNVAAGSTFAALQSAGVLGTAVTTKAAIAGVSGTVAAVTKYLPSPSQSWIPSKKTVLIAATAGTSAVIAAPVVIWYAGFTAAGVASASIAAGVQSSIGNVVAGSTFAALQSAGVLGTAITTKAAIAGVSGTVAAGVNKYLS